MKSIPTAFGLHLGGFQQTLAICWKITRADGDILGFTDHDRDITFGGLTYDAKTGITRSALHVSNSLSVDNAQIESVLNSEKISDDDIRANLYDGCTVEIFIVNYTDPTNQNYRIKKGQLGQIQLTSPTYTGEFLGLTEKAAITCVDCYSPDCRVQLGSTRCGYSFVTDQGHVTSIVGSVEFHGTHPLHVDGYYKGGLLTWTSGNNSGYSIEVQDSIGSDIGHSNDDRIVTWLEMPHSVQIGDDYNICVGCDHSFSTCCSKFNNHVNFRGEHLLPGLDQIVLYPNAQSPDGGGGGGK